MTFWKMLTLTFGLISVAVLSPIPLLVPLVLWLVSRPVEQPLAAEIKRAGGNPEAVPNPTAGRSGCAAFVAWALVWGGLALIALSMLLAIVEGAGL